MRDRWTDPVRWHADRIAENAEKRRRRNDPAYLAEKREERRLRCARLGRNNPVFFVGERQIA